MFEKLLLNEVNGGQGKNNPVAMLLAMYGKTPGPNDLLEGDVDLGYFGTVSSEELLNQKDLGFYTGYWGGLFNQPLPIWFKFAYKKKIVYIPKTAIRTHSNWNELEEKGLIFGNKDTTIFRHLNTLFLTRLINAADETFNQNSVTSNLSSDDVFLNSEWGQLLGRVSSNNTWFHLDDKWLTYSDNDLGFIGNGSRTLTQNTIVDTTNVLTRGQGAVSNISLLNKNDNFLHHYLTYNFDNH